MTTNQLGIRNSNIIVPYTAATKRTKQVDLTISATNFVNTRSVGVAYADSNGVWRLSFNASLKGNGSVGSVTGVTFTVTGVVFKSGTDVYQPLSVFQSNSLAGQAITTPGASTFTYNNPGSIDLSSRAVDVSGDVELNAEPSWAAANMEGVVAVDVYIPPASATALGLANGSVAFSVSASANQTGLTSGATTKVSFNTEEVDSSNSFDPTTNYRFTAPRGGIYNFCSQVKMNNAATISAASVLLYKNNALCKTLGTFTNSASTTGVIQLGGSASIQVVAGDYFEIFVNQTGGGTYNILGSATDTFFTGCMLP